LNGYFVSSCLQQFTDGRSDIPFPNEETTPPVTKMYFVSATIVKCYCDNFFKDAKVQRRIKNRKSELAVSSQQSAITVLPWVNVDFSVLGNNFQQKTVNT